MFLLNWTMHDCSALLSNCLFQLYFLSDDSSLFFHKITSCSRKGSNCQSILNKIIVLSIRDIYSWLVLYSKSDFSCTLSLLDSYLYIKPSRLYIYERSPPHNGCVVFPPLAISLQSKIRSCIWNWLDEVKWLTMMEMEFLTSMRGKMSK